MVQNTGTRRSPSTHTLIAPMKIVTLSCKEKKHNVREKITLIQMAAMPCQEVSKQCGSLQRTIIKLKVKQQV